MNTNNLIGNEADITFVDIGKTIKGKVDTGATTSSIHATNIKINQHQVSFVCDVISPNVITMDIAGSQEVHTADAGGEQRPTVKFNIKINDVQLPNVLFNLNDRSNMDDPVLIGQNILQAGNFIVDVNKQTESSLPLLDDDKLIESFAYIATFNLTPETIITYINTAKVAVKE